ncbi:hypothetical protein HO173_003986 [Letharia columbiana]|uniref:RCC1/BLIP-II protein n=1 Tax=Letharia columbiana TaxID=112416 RepID=A0A8H6FZI5_9LECA|nr:uncharacterized protein HO173_003986 [Letharia columbiana]KAF6237785.1 hypothetical protein HO173_003986 [Letharia columbiana]
MELHMCGFNTHHQLDHNQDHHKDEITQFWKVLRSPQINVSCALWSSTVIQSDGTLLHQGYRPSGLYPTLIDGPPPRNIKTIFGDTSGVLGALTTDGCLFLYHDDCGSRVGPEFKKHRFPEDSFIVQQSLAIEHLAIADNGEVCICTNSASRKRHSGGNTPSLSDSTPHFLFSPPTAKIEIQLFSSFQSLLVCEPATATHFIQTPLFSLLSSATSFTALTVTREVLTFGSALHPQSLGRDPTVSNPAGSPCVIPFLGGIPIGKIAVGGWIGAAVSEDRDLYIWGGRAGEDRRMHALPKFSDDETVRLVDINGGVDILQVGVGSGHVIALTAEGEVWAAGDGECGQLGTGEMRFEEDWVRVRGEWEERGKVVGLGCGVWCSWILVDTRTTNELEQ